MVVLKELIFNSFYIWREGVVVLKELIFVTVSTFGGGCGGLLRELIFNSFYF